MKCGALKPNGEPCKRRVKKPDQLCYQHRPATAAEERTGHSSDRAITHQRSDYGAVFRAFSSTRRVLTLLLSALILFGYSGWLSQFGDRWLATVWLGLLSSGQWIYLRLAHEVRGIQGEAANDGVVWVVPILTFSSASIAALFVANLLWFTVMLCIFGFLNYQIERNLRLEWEPAEEACLYRTPLPFEGRPLKTLATPGLQFSKSRVDPKSRRESHTSHSFTLFFAGSTGVSMLTAQDDAWIPLWLATVIPMALFLGGGILYIRSGAETTQRWFPQEGEAALIGGLYTALLLGHMFITVFFVLGIESLRLP